MSPKQARVCGVQEGEDPWSNLQQDRKETHFTGGRQLSNFGGYQGARSDSGNISISSGALKKILECGAVLGVLRR